MARPVGWVYSDVFLEHDMGPGHPESPQRLAALVRHLEETGLASELTKIEPRPCPMEWIEEIHAPEYIRFVQDVCKAGGGLLDYGDTYASPRSYDAALLAAGGGLAAVDAVLEGTLARAFCAVRPPGHHAERDRAMGFCIFNNIAVAAAYARKRHGIARVLVVDWDVHHGNGTEHAFYGSKGVSYFSVHQYPHYPGTGAAGDEGVGEGEGFTLNVPLAGGADDDVYVGVFADRLLPHARDFRPELILISAGFDAHRSDPLAGMQVTEDGFREMTRFVCDLADETAQGRVVSFLEGGYHPQAMPRSVEAHLRQMGE